jgi:MerR family regulatory protein
MGDLTNGAIRELILLMVQRTDTALHPGELAKATGVSADTIRHYERIGVLQKHSERRQVIGPMEQSSDPKCPLHDLDPALRWRNGTSDRSGSKRRRGQRSEITDVTLTVVIYEAFRRGGAQSSQAPCSHGTRPVFRLRLVSGCQRLASLHQGDV